MLGIETPIKTVEFVYVLSASFAEMFSGAPFAEIKPTVIAAVSILNRYFPAATDVADPADTRRLTAATLHP
jgi:hypothetical protein